MSEKMSNTENYEVQSSEVSTEKNLEGTSRYALTAISEGITELKLPEEVIAKWKELLVAIKVVDDVLDSMEGESDRKEFVSKLGKFLDGDDVDFSGSPKLESALNTVLSLAENLPPDRKKFLINSLKRILKITEEIKVEENIDEFSAMTRLEGQITAKIFLQFLPDEFIQSPKYQKLMKAFTRLGRVGNGFDTFIDLPGDYRAGQTMIKPTPLNRLLILGAVLTDGLSFLKSSGIPKNLLSGLITTTRKHIRSKKK